MQRVHKSLKLIATCRSPPSVWLRRGISYTHSEIQGETFSSLDSLRSVITLEGEDAVDFLQGLITNDISELKGNVCETSSQQGSAFKYGHLLNSKGKYLHDVFLTRTRQGLLLDVDKNASKDLVMMLKRYALRRKLKISDASAEYRVWVHYTLGARQVDAPEAQSGLSQWGIDPRLKLLGWRGIMGDSYAPPEGTHVAPAESFQKMRLGLGIAEGDSEIPPGSISLEYNLEWLNGISFSKGCYIGQELMARTHHQGMIRKRIMPFVGGRGTSVGEDVFQDRPDGKKVGQIRACVDDVGIALLRMQDVFDGQSGVVRKLFTQHGHELKAYKPVWWPI